jgi:hypothetical protein
MGLFGIRVNLQGEVFDDAADDLVLRPFAVNGRSVGLLLVIRQTPTDDGVLGEGL